MYVFSYGRFEDIPDYLYVSRIKRRYYKTINVPAQYQLWTQPVLTSNGTMGGDTFGCDQEAYYEAGSVEPPQQMFYLFSNMSGEWQINTVSTSKFYWGKFYSPVPIVLSQISFANFDPTYAPNYIKVYGSNDDSSYTLIGEHSSWGQTTGFVPVPLIGEQQLWKYFKVEIRPRAADAVMLSRVQVTASTLVSDAYSYEEEVSKDEAYDRYEDEETPYLLLSGRNKRYYKTWSQPQLTSNTSYGTLLATSQFDDVGTHDAWHAFSYDAHQWISSPAAVYEQQIIVWQLPNDEKIYISSVDFIAGDILARFPTKIDVYGSNDLGQSFTLIGSATPEPGYGSASTYTLTVDCNKSTAYNTIGFAFTKSVSADNLTAMADIAIHAQVDGTADDYDVLEPPPIF